uniref:surfeit locus protein 1 isoform X1 n=3 Tax=Myxine glutinosa TaxID=7769 RepID=UPI0035901421
MCCNSQWMPPMARASPPSPSPSLAGRWFESRAALKMARSCCFLVRLCLLLFDPTFRETTFPGATIPRADLQESKMAMTAFLRLAVRGRTSVCGSSLVDARSRMSRVITWTRRASKMATERTGEQDPVMKWLLLAVPVSAFGLGTWQVKRLLWKQDLIANLEHRTRAPPVDLPPDPLEMPSLEYRRMRVRGTFDHGNEMIILPRSRLDKGQAESRRGVVGRTSQHGAQVVTPFVCSDLGITILVNRGFVPMSRLDPASRTKGQVEGEVELVGLVRLNEPRSAFTPDDDVANRRWHSRDVSKLAQAAGTFPIFLDAVADSTVPGGPIGGQTNVSLRNDHTQYLLTWYGLSALTLLLWVQKFVRKL